MPKPVTALDRFAPEDRPPVSIPFQTYHLMAGLGKRARRVLAARSHADDDNVDIPLAVRHFRLPRSSKPGASGYGSRNVSGSK